MTELRFFCCTVRIEYANRFKSNYPTEKEPARLSVLSDLIGIIIFFPINPLFFPGFPVCLMNKPVSVVQTWFADDIKLQKAWKCFFLAAKPKSWWSYRCFLSTVGSCSLFTQLIQIQLQKHQNGVGVCPSLRQSSWSPSFKLLELILQLLPPPKWPFTLASLTFRSLRKWQKWVFKSQQAGCVRWMKAWGVDESLNGGGWHRETRWWGEGEVTCFVVCELQPLTGCLIWELSHLFSHERERDE